MMVHLNNAEGQRVAKGTLTAFSCNMTPDPTTGLPANCFALSRESVLGPSGEQLTETDGNGNWLHTNVYAAGKLLATYSYTDSTHTATDTYFALSDWLGTKRAVVSAGGCGTGYVSLPYGDSLTPSNLPGFTQCPDATENHFTGKERDAESGNDYFGARYYASSMARFTSPDHPLIDQHPENPQSWNLYAYSRNNPLINIDPTGLGCVTDRGRGSDANHESVELNNSISSDDCAGQHGTWVPGDVNQDNIGAYRGSDGNINFQATTNTGGNVYYSSFVSGAQTDANGVGPGASIAHTSADWLSSQLVGGSLDQLMSFAARRMEPRGGGGMMALLAGPGFSPDAPDNWAGPGGMGTRRLGGDGT
jgi:RHS repeat-associated protein